MELLTGKGGLSPEQAAEANRTYEEIALSNFSDEAPQAVCANSVGAALGDETARKSIEQSTSAVADAKHRNEMLEIQNQGIRDSLKAIEENSLPDRF
jgi:hypothetical protein